MQCKKCGKNMVEQKRSFHKKRKWVCPSCGRARMQPGKYKRQRKKTKDAD